MKSIDKPVREPRLRALLSEAQVALMGLLSVGAVCALMFAASTTFAGGM